MKEYKKWSLRHFNPQLTASQVEENAWEAALRWVLSEIHEHREPMDVIEEELGGRR